jgi:hypothetical protein
MIFVSAHGRPVCSSVAETRLNLDVIAIPVQRNDLAILSHSFDRRSAALIWGGPLGRNIVGVGNPEELSQVSIQPSKLFHSSLD